MSEVYHKYVKALNETIENGHAFIDVNLPFLPDHRLALKSFIERRLQTNDSTKWIYQIDGEDEGEAGLVLPRVGKDLKYSFHDSHYLRQKIASEKVILTAEDIKFLELNQKLYNHASEIAANLIMALGIRYKNRQLLNSYLDSCRKVIPYSITILRGLYYPKAIEQKGAKKHIDKNLITIHFGDVGGNLVFYQGLNDENGQVLFIPEGKAVVFFGVKILWVTKGKIKPLWHGSITRGGIERMANPFFAHTEVPGYEVRDAREALTYYNTIVNIDKYYCHK